MLGRLVQPTVGPLTAREVEPGAQAIILAGETIAEQRWGLLAPWRGHGGVRPAPIRTATLEELARTPVLRKAARCLVPASGILVKSKHGGKVRVWRVTAGDDARFAAVSATSKDDGVPAFCLLVVPAPAALAAYTEVVPALADAAWREGGPLLEEPWRAVDPAANLAQGSLF